MKKINLVIMVILLSLTLSGCFSIFPKALKPIITAQSSVCFVGDKIVLNTYIENSDKSIKNINGEIYINGIKQDDNIFAPVEAGKYIVTSKYDGMES